MTAKISSTEPNLDPEDWDEFSRASHAALDDMIAFLRTVRDRKVWQQLPAEAAERFDTALPHEPRDLAEVLDEFKSSIAPYTTGNAHPLFMGWVHGAGTPAGMVAEMLAGGLNANCGGRNHVGINVENQITRWAAELFGFPDNSSGLFVTGTSMANLMGLLVARTAALGESCKSQGLGGFPQLTAYTSEQVHSCVTRAAEMSGVGSDNLRLIPVDAAGAMRVDLLAEAIETDIRQGARPFLVVGTAGTVNTGAFDDLNELSALCRRHGLWFHVDGAFGAMCSLSPDLRPLLSGIERADSVAFDFHKWAHVPYDAGFLLVRDPDIHRRTFSSPAAYLSRASSGLAAGEVWPCDLGPDLSRGFRALKTWLTFQTLGAKQIGACIDHSCRVAKHLEAMIEQSDLFEMRAPVRLNIVCFGLKTQTDDKLNEAIVIDLHQRGVAAPSTTRLNGRLVIRAAIVNHRTTEGDMDQFVQELSRSALRVTLAQMKGRIEVEPVHEPEIKAGVFRA
ncbi:pyridoxal phosphate-dependent decarboxylase family protein [Rhodoplanes sp. Z2-YC6860]|uniref:pyridoxal phosphate-dependent decarboxylase family protein n=1 Tax=Rhodoplanes sp. Z2-YC6860 TaxID=674703 RepID=UPI00078C48F6|nr:pyridoxal-dependent decarboxylase [Rhodoplanes sp. Z2-YC6860]AMN45105.1 pyridoxal-dependent decarboxylase [Rhodoplanes sp. Z2-YC6860]